MNVCAIIVTRGDVDVMPCFETIPEHWQKLVWVNGDRLESWGPQGYMQDAGVLELGGGGAVFPDLSVYGRYEAIRHTSAELIFVQDDDCVVSDPQAIVDALWLEGEFVKRSGERTDRYGPRKDVVACNMPQEFRHDGYTDSCLVGFGACFHRDAPARAFERVFPFMIGPGGSDADWEMFTGLDADGKVLFEIPSIEWFHRTCDVVFTTLTPRVLVDVPKVNREFAEDASRMYRQPGHTEERQRMLELARRVRDA